MRNIFDLSHYSFMAGKMGQLQTLGVIPVIAGDSLTINVDSLIRMSPLRRQLSVDAQVDKFLFYVPHRQIYGQDWIDFIKDGVDSTVSLGSTIIAAGTADISYMGAKKRVGRVYPDWSLYGYSRIWDRYFRFLKLTPEVGDWVVNDSTRPPTHTVDNSPISTTVDTARYGFRCARLKTPWSTGIVSGITDDDHIFDAPVVATDAKVDLLDLEIVRQRYKTEIEREFFMTRYNDVLRGAFGSGVNIDADERPELLMRKTHSLKGYDIDGTDDATLGVSSGKSLTNTTLKLNRKFFPEHGAVYIMALVRFPAIAYDETNRLSDKTVPTYTQIAGDYDIVKVQPPEDITAQQYHTNGGAIAIGQVPFGQEYRWHENLVHVNYLQVDGFPFIKDGDLAGGHVNHVYSNAGEYDDVFQNQQLGHYTVQSSVNIQAHRNYPTARESIMAGTKA